MEKSEMMKYLSDIRSFYGAYHNHKEVSAWGAVALVVILLLQTTNDLNELGDITEYHKYALYAFVLLLALVACLYIYAQQSGKKYASNVVTACTLLETNVLGIGKNEFTAVAYSFDEGSSTTMQAERSLPKFLRDEADEIAKVVKGRLGRILDKSRYGLVGLVTALALSRIWLLPVAIGN